jgi:hypothetical protein
MDDLDPTQRVLKRAQYEAFTFSLLGGDVLVRNESHLVPTDHEYRVTIVDGVPATCQCPADRRYDGPCKHRVAIAIRPCILDLATTVQLLTDGGPATSDTSSERSDEAEPHQCNCGNLHDDFPCWECVRTGRRKLSG